MGVTMDDEHCPKCNAVFPANRAWAKRTVTMLVVAPALQDLDTRVRCPTCGYVFQATSYRFFGFVSPGSFKVFVGLLFAAAVVAAIYIGFIGSP
jgi:uncharacterized C2H2 Zn-finger protein